MNLPLWILVILIGIFIVSNLYQIHIKNKFFRFLCNSKGRVSVFQAMQWLQKLANRQKELQKRGKPYLNLEFEGEWIGSRLWKMWLDQAEKTQRAILISKIYLGTELKTPIEMAIEGVEEYIRGHIDGDNDIKYWCSGTEKDFNNKTIKWPDDMDIHDLQRCYSAEDVKYILTKIREFWKHSDKENCSDR